MTRRSPSWPRPGHTLPRYLILASLSSHVTVDNHCLHEFDLDMFANSFTLFQLQVQVLVVKIAFAMT